MSKKDLLNAIQFSDVELVYSGKYYNSLGHDGVRTVPSRRRDSVDVIEDDARVQDAQVRKILKEVQQSDPALVTIRHGSKAVEKKFGEKLGFHRDLVIVSLKYPHRGDRTIHMKLTRGTLKRIEKALGEKF